MHALLAELGYTGSESQALRNYCRARNRLHKAKLKVSGTMTPQILEDLKEVVAGGGYISEHFRFSEFRCTCRGRFKDCRGVRIRPALIRALEELRAKWYPRGMPLISTGRCPGRNREVGGASLSKHLTWLAADVVPVIPATYPMPKQIGGIGINRSTNKISHVDARRRVFGGVVKWYYGR